MRKSIFLTCFVFLTIFTSRASLADTKSFSKNFEDPEVPVSMGTLGDSISAGVLAAYSRSEATNPLVMFKILVDVINHFRHRSLGPLEKRYLSWSAGIDPWRRVNSHAYRLKTLNSSLQVHDVSVTGSNSSEVLHYQIPKLQQLSQKSFNKNFPDYTTLLIGANDVCAESVAQMTDPGVFQDNITRILQAVLSQSESSRVLVVDLPAIHKVRDNEQSSLSRFRFLRSCGDIWKYLSFCENVLKRFKPENAQIIEERVLVLNQILKDMVTQLRTEYGDRVRFAAATFNHGVGADDLAVDCFHPNSNGQRMIAENTWSQSWWASQWSAQKAIQHQEKEYELDPEWLTDSIQ